LVTVVPFLLPFAVGSSAVVVALVIAAVLVVLRLLR